MQDPELSSSHRCCTSTLVPKQTWHFLGPIQSCTCASHIIKHHEVSFASQHCCRRCSYAIRPSHSGRCVHVCVCIYTQVSMCTYCCSLSFIASSSSSVSVRCVTSNALTAMAGTTPSTGSCMPRNCQSNITGWGIATPIPPKKCSCRDVNDKPCSTQ